MTTWTPERIEALAIRWRCGQSVRAIGAALGVSHNAVSSKARRLGLPRRPHILTP